MAGHGLWVCLFSLMVVQDIYNGQAAGATNKCSWEIIQAIERHWNESGKWELGYPSPIIPVSKRKSPEIVYWTSERYYGDQDELTCLYSIFADNGFGLVNRYINGSTSVSFIEQVEITGYLLEPKTNIKRFHMDLDDAGVTCWYKCSDAEDAPEGPPEGAIKVSRGFSEEGVVRAVKALASVNITITHKYSLSCNPCYTPCKA